MYSIKDKIVVVEYGILTHTVNNRVVFGPIKIHDKNIFTELQTALIGKCISFHLIQVTN